MISEIGDPLVGHSHTWNMFHLSDRT